MGRAMMILSWLLLGACHSSRPGALAEPDEMQRARQLATRTPGGQAGVDEEILVLEHAVEGRPGHVDSWIELGRAWVKKARNSGDPGFYLNAKAAADVALGLEPDAPAALNLQALVLINNHRFERARQLCQRILARNPDDVMALGSLSDALVELGRTDEASVAVDRMTALKPNHPAYTRASYLSWLTGDTPAAIEAMRLAIDAADRRDPEPRAWALSHAAVYFWHQGDYPGADAGFDLALRAMPGYPPALVGKARIALGKGDPARAQSLLERAYQQNPLPETAWLLGDARALRGDSAGAEDAYAILLKQGRRTDPRILSLFLATSGRDPEGALALAREEQKSRGDVYTWDTLAWALFRSGRLEEARAASREATRLGTRDALLLYHAGAIRLAAGDREGSALLRQAIALNPQFDVHGAAEARRLLGKGDRP